MNWEAVGETVGLSIHAPARGATQRRRNQATRRNFQSTPPRGGRPRRRPRTRSSARSFNPRPREGGDNISTQLFDRGLLFQSTPPRGGRHGTMQAFKDIGFFQSTPPRGGRPFQPTFPMWRLAFQSTPPRGGRLRCTAHSAKSFPFNPRPREGGDGGGGHMPPA